MACDHLDLFQDLQLKVSKDVPSSLLRPKTNMQSFLNFFQPKIGLHGGIEAMQTFERNIADRVRDEMDTVVATVETSVHDGQFSQH